MLQTPPQTAVQVAGNLAPVLEQLPPGPIIIPTPSFTVCSDKSGKLLLAVVLMLFVIAVFIAAMFQYRFHPLLTIFFVFFLALYTTLYFWHSLRLRTSSYQYHHQRAGLRRGLGYTAIFLGHILSAIFIYASTRLLLLTLQQAIAAWIFAVPLGYSLYLVMVLHLEEEECGVDPTSSWSCNRMQST